MAAAGEGRGSLIGRGPRSRLDAQASLPTGSAPFLSPFVGVTANNHARLSSHLDSSMLHMPARLARPAAGAEPINAQKSRRRLPWQTTDRRDRGDGASSLACSLRAPI